MGLTFWWLYLDIELVISLVLERVFREATHEKHVQETEAGVSFKSVFT